MTDEIEGFRDRWEAIMRVGPLDHRLEQTDTKAS